MGEGPARDRHGVVGDAADALAAAGLTPIELAEQEGLALINDTDGMLILAIADLRELLVMADIRAAMRGEGLLSTDAVFTAELRALRPHPGQAVSAANIHRLLADSEIVASHRGPEDPRVQDAYSLRCAAAVAGGARNTVAHAAAVAERELAASVDNPVTPHADSSNPTATSTERRSPTRSISSPSSPPTSPTSPSGAPIASSTPPAAKDSPRSLPTIPASIPAT